MDSRIHHSTTANGCGGDAELQRLWLSKIHGVEESGDETEGVKLLIN